MKVSDIMYPAHRISINSTVAEAARHMADNSIGSVFIESAGDIKGILTERDIVRKVVAEGTDPRRIMVFEIMSAPVISVTPETSIDEASEIMSKRQIRRLAVVEDGRIVGKVTANLISKSMKYYLGVKLFKREEGPRVL